MMNSAEIRQAFLDFFKSKGHQIVPSAPIVVKNDPTLLFTNAGMNQFKDYFLGNGTPVNPRIADTQKCLRVSGKHNDLEEVGVDTYHHTMFEMLGNWSFGDYFKKEAIDWSWELLTEVYKLDKDRLYVTIFEGDAKENLPKDEEAYNEWKKVTTEDRILLGNKKDNFWEMGDTGPCGPCTEIHFDCRPDEERKAISGATLVNNDHPQVIEIWNNVFMQFERYWNPKLGGSKDLKQWESDNISLTLNPDTKNNFDESRKQKHLDLTLLKNLPATHVDTGMGFERLVRVIQGKHSNYDTDVFTGTIEEIKKITKKTDDLIFIQPTSIQSVSVRVIADHIRAISFCIADGQLPSNTGAGYVIRRILRRAVRYYYSYLDYKQPLLYQLVPMIAKQFENVFPELNAQKDFVGKVIREEEDAFLRTLDKGLKRIDEIINLTFASKNNTINGKEIFELFDTYGFPIDLTRLIAQENSLFIDEAGFEIEMQQQKNRSRAATAIDAGDWVIINTIDEIPFVGYTQFETNTKICQYRKVTSKGKEQYQIVLGQTPFYAESGGQVGDRGLLEVGSWKLEVVDTKKENGLTIHFVETLPEDIDLTKDVIASVNTATRVETSSNHSATHLLHAALRKVLGTHVAQKGSLVNDEQLRFDFSHFAKVTDEEFAQVEAIVNQKIRENIPVVIKEMNKDEAVALGAMALFGEKYGDVVRVVIMDAKYSIELCGGTHIGSTGELGFFKIKSESAVAAGVRRIEAVSGKAAEAYINNTFSKLSLVKDLFNNPKELIKQIENSLAETKELKKKIESLEARNLLVQVSELLKTEIPLGSVKFIGENVIVSSPEHLKKLCNFLVADLQDSGFIILTSKIESKPFIAIAIGSVLANQRNFDASAIIKNHIAPLIKGGGGGSKTLATAGGQDASNLNKVIEVVKGLL